VRLWQSGEGSAGDLLVGSDERDHLELWTWRLAPQDRHGSEAHAEGTREMVAVLSGTLTLEVAGTDHLIPPGGAAMYPADRPHSYRNDGSLPVELVMVVIQPDADLDEWRAKRASPGSTA
jgi:quercetin dioxygenase-like cupin family protein